jgi:hypothetical protein
MHLVCHHSGLGLVVRLAQVEQNESRPLHIHYYGTVGDIETMLQMLARQTVRFIQISSVEN